MTEDDRNIEAARFLRWNTERGGDWLRNFATWQRERVLSNADAFLICYVVMGALLIPTADELLAAWNDPATNEPPF